MAFLSFAIKDLKLIPIVFTAWIRYILGIDLGIDNEGKAFELRSDSMFSVLQENLKGIELGKWQTARNPV
jgi:fructuronate reductase